MIQTEAVEGYISIQRRTRQAKKYQHQLQQELLEVDRQRRAVAVKMDEVRYNHEAASKKTEVRFLTSRSRPKFHGTDAVNSVDNELGRHSKILLG